jgi:hypothetical protein
MCYCGISYEIGPSLIVLSLNDTRSAEVYSAMLGKRRISDDWVSLAVN